MGARFSHFAVFRSQPFSRISKKKCNKKASKKHQKCIRNRLKSRFRASWDPLGTILGPSWVPCSIFGLFFFENRSAFLPFWGTLLGSFLCFFVSFWALFFPLPFRTSFCMYFHRFWDSCWSRFGNFFEHPCNVLGEVPAAVPASPGTIWRHPFSHFSASILALPSRPLLFSLVLRFWYQFWSPFSHVFLPKGVLKTV